MVSFEKIRKGVLVKLNPVGFQVSILTNAHYARRAEPCIYSAGLHDIPSLSGRYFDYSLLEVICTDGQTPAYETEDRLSSQ